ncbi:hypothetical protein [uncultured Shewanella sp.]|uniref:hypothetical protein n=1 Tax=uncultured Shewanella sp. TaxID=173975 RepID=UPI00261ACD30|nr:hypothetical protein [uncultured Shewanella sp.]
MRQQYHFRKIPTPGNVTNTFIWDVNKLIVQSNKLPTVHVNLSEITELDRCYWYESNESIPTCRNIVEHMQLVNEADLNYPILLCQNGKVIDGMHRVCKALMSGHTTIKAKQFTNNIPPDYINVDPNALPYD